MDRRLRVISPGEQVHRVPRRLADRARGPVTSMKAQFRTMDGGRASDTFEDPIVLVAPIEPGRYALEVHVTLDGDSGAHGSATFWFGVEVVATQDRCDPAIPLARYSVGAWPRSTVPRSDESTGPTHSTRLRPARRDSLGFGGLSVTWVRNLVQGRRHGTSATGGGAADPRYPCDFHRALSTCLEAGSATTPRSR